jgi:Uncharacterized protein conserved in bacteria (DUF2064)
MSALFAKSMISPLYVVRTILTPACLFLFWLFFKKELDAVVKILLYAPPTDHARTTMRELLQTLNLLNDWQLHPVKPMVDGVQQPHNVHSSQFLSTILSHAVDVGRQQHHHPSNVATTVILLGMDAPELPLAEIVAACDPSRRLYHSAALMCPAADGGYGLLVVPPLAPAQSIFDGVLWSHELTALSQLKALSDQGVATVIGPLMHDIDTARDLDQLVQRLESTTASESSLDGRGCLSQPSALVQRQSTGSSDHGDPMEPSFVSCHYTRKVLVDLGLLQAKMR